MKKEVKCIPSLQVSEKELKHQARNTSIKEGIFASIRTSFGDHYISPFAIALNASDSLVALLGSFTGLFGALSQSYGAKLMEKHSRKKILLNLILLESLIWFPMIILAWLFTQNILTNFLPIFLIFLFTIYTIMSNMGNPAFFSWLGDLISTKKRGRWFAKRNLIIGFTSVILAILASFMLDYMKSKNMTMTGFSILFFLAFLGRLASWKTFQKQYEPTLCLKKGYYFSFKDFIKNAHKTNFGKFAIYRFFFSFVCAISSPLLAVYLLRHLGFSYSTYMIITFAGTFFSLIILGFWGKFADKYGNYKTIYISCIGILILPFLWVLNKSPTYLILIPALINGTAWAGFHLSEKNFTYDNVSKPKRGLALSYYNILWGTGTFLGAALGALLIKIIKIPSIETIIFIFILGGILRFLVVIIGIPKIKEIRPILEFKSSDAINIITKQAKPTLLEELHQIISIKEYFHHNKK